MTRRIPVQHFPEVAALRPRAAAAYCGYSASTLWRLANLPSSHPLHVTKAKTGVYWIKELDRHLQAATERNRA